MRQPNRTLKPPLWQVLRNFVKREQLLYAACFVRFFSRASRWMQIPNTVIINEMEKKEMKLTSLLQERQLSVYQCAKESTVPYTTLLDIVKGKTRIEKCTAETLYKLAKTLNVAMEELLAECFREAAEG